MNRFRVLSVWLCGAIGMCLTGCGFVNVRTLTPGLVKTGVAVFAPASVLTAATVDAMTSTSHHGVSIAGFSADSITAIMSDLQKSHAQVVVFVAPTPAMRELAARMPHKRFVWIGYGGPAPAAPNVTWVLPNVLPLASVAGYLAGGIQGSGLPVAVVLGQLPSSFNTGTVVAAVYSGIHSAYSSAAAAVINAGPQTPAAGIAGSRAQAYIVVGRVATQTLLDVQQSGVPFIPLDLGTGVPLSGPELGRRVNGRFVASGLASVFSILDRGGALPRQLISGSAQDLAAPGYGGWQGAAGVAAYQAALAQGNITPDQFTAAAPSPASAAALGLPVPAAQRKGSGAQTTSPTNHSG